MKTEEIIKTLEQFNAWRRNDSIPNDIEMPDPKLLGQAIDGAVSLLKNRDDIIKQYCNQFEDTAIRKLAYTVCFTYEDFKERRLEEIENGKNN